MIMKRLDEIMEVLLTVKNANFSDFVIENNALYFKYSGGRFVAFKSMTGDLKLGH